MKSSNFYDAWISMLDHVQTYGQEVSPRGIKVREIIGTQMVVENALENIIVHPLRDANYRFMIAEWLWMQGGRKDVATVARYNKQIARFSDDGETFAGAYGPKIMDQWQYLKDTLTKDGHSRQAVMTIWERNPKPSKDYPCTCMAQFFIRDGKLHSVWTMRSNDLWLGLTYDYFNFSQITNALAADLGKSVGSLTLNAGSSHIYESNFEAVNNVLDHRADGECLRSPRLPMFPMANTILGHQFSAMYLNNIEKSYAEALQSSSKADALRILRDLDALAKVTA